MRDRDQNSQTGDGPTGASPSNNVGPQAPSRPGTPFPAEDRLQTLFRRILILASRTDPELEFERQAGRLLLEFTGCREVEFGTGQGRGRLGSRVFLQRDGAEVRIETIPFGSDVDETSSPEPDTIAARLAVGDRSLGYIRLRGCRRNARIRQPEALGALGETLALALMSKRVQWALGERVKELGCLYEISRLTQKDGIPLEEILQSVVRVIPPAWQYPEITQCRLTVDGAVYTTEGFTGQGAIQWAPIVEAGRQRGAVEVLYTEERPELDEGPFLREERKLIDAVAAQIGLLLERKRSDDNRQQLELQLRHADRLATIGQLAAGVAHELNEPLGAIIGFGQLAKQSAGMPEQAGRDVEKILAAALHAREVVRKLMLFARQTAPRKDLFDLNDLVDEGLYFLESRCARSGIQVVKEIHPKLPRIQADKGQVQQVLVNLAVNAVQAMGEGGVLTLRTGREEGSVVLEVEDTGSGMTEDVRSKVFLPFFTTKDVGQGTGLGLSVVHGIVTAHGGDIKVESGPGKGSRFQIFWPLEQVGGE